MWGRLVAPGNREEKLWVGAEGVLGSPMDTQFLGTPEHSRPVASKRRELGCCLGTPIPWILSEWCGCCGCWAFPARTRQPGFSRDHWGGRVPSLSFCHVALRGPGRVQGEVGGGFCTGDPLCSVLRCAVRPVTFTAARAQHRVSGIRDGLELGVSGEHGTRGPGCTAPPPSVSSLPRPD